MTSILMLLAGLVLAESTTQPCDKVRSVRNEIRPDAKAISISKENDVCTIEWTPKPGHVVTYTDHQAADDAIRTELGTLEDKLDAGTITQAEMRRMVKIMLKLIRISKS